MLYCESLAVDVVDATVTTTGVNTHIRAVLTVVATMAYLFSLLSGAVSIIDGPDCA